MVFVLGGTIEGKVIGKDEDLFLSLSITSLFAIHRQVLLLLLRYWKLLSLPFICLLKVEWSLWISSMEQQQPPW